MHKSMPSGLRPVTTVVGDDEEPMRLPIVRAVTAGGGAIVGEATSGRTLLPLVALLQPQLVVFDIAMGGALGVSIVPGLFKAAPRATVAVFDQLGVLRSADLRRLRVLDKDDPRELRQLVTELATPIVLEAERARRPRPTS